MTTFDERERAFEAKYVLDEEMAFKALARRDKALGLWAGQQLGKQGPELDAYVREVMRSDLQHVGDEEVFEKVSGDLRGRVEPDEVRRRMEELLHTAQAQIAAGD